MALGRYLDAGAHVFTSKVRASRSLAVITALVVASWAAAAALAGNSTGGMRLDVTAAGWGYAAATGVYMLWGECRVLIRPPPSPLPFISSATPCWHLISQLNPRDLSGCATVLQRISAATVIAVLENLMGSSTQG